MHEMSVALEVCRIAEQYAGRERLGDVVEVAVEVGDAAGVEIGNLEFCLEALLSAPPPRRPPRPRAARPVRCRRAPERRRAREWVCSPARA